MSIEGNYERVPQKIEVHPATREDVDGLEKLYRETWIATYPNEEAGVSRKDIEARLAEVYSPETRPMREMRIQHLPQGESILVAKQGGEIVGSCRVVRAGTKTPNEFAVYVDNQLMSLYVSPEFQGKAVGSQLWNESKERLDPAKDTVLMVASYNDKAIRFYESQGFVLTGDDVINERFRLESGSVIPQRLMVLQAKIQETL